MAEPSMLTVVVMGVGIVFVGLIALVIIISIMNAIFGSIKPKEAKVSATPNPSIPAADAKLAPEAVAAVSAAIAESLGRDVSGIRILSIKKTN